MIITQRGNYSLSSSGRELCRGARVQNSNLVDVPWERILVVANNDIYFPRVVFLQNWLVNSHSETMSLKMEFIVKKT